MEKKWLSAANIVQAHSFMRDKLKAEIQDRLLDLVNLLTFWRKSGSQTLISMMVEGFEKAINAIY